MKKVIIGFLALTLFIGVSFLVGAFVYFQISVSSGLGKFTTQACAKNPEPTAFNAAPYYSGSLFDTHLHIPSVLKPPKIIKDTLLRNLGQEYAVLGNQITMAKILCLMDRENITRAVSFFPVLDLPVLRNSFIKVARQSEQMSQNRFIPFMQPSPAIHPVPDVSGLKKILDKGKGTFKGYGELAFYWDKFQDLSPDDPIFLESYNILKERGLAVMIHPDNGQIDALEKAFVEFPEVIFILHSMNSDDPFNHLLGTYPNVYYTLDSPGLYPLFESQSKEEFMNIMKEDFHSVLNDALGNWKHMIEANPEKVMWGTDRFTPWSYDPEVGVVLEEYYRAFIARLAPSVQELYAHRNAEKIFGN